MAEEKKQRDPVTLVLLLVLVAAVLGGMWMLGLSVDNGVERIQQRLETNRVELASQIRSLNKTTAEILAHEVREGQSAAQAPAAPAAPADAPAAAPADAPAANAPPAGDDGDD